MATRRVNWTKVKAEYTTNPNATQETLSAKHGVSRTAISNKSAKEGWTAIREANLQKISLMIADISKVNIAEFQAKKFAAGLRLAEFGESRIHKADRVSALSAKMIAELGWKISSEALGLDKEGATINLNVITVQGLVEEMRKKELDDESPAGS